MANDPTELTLNGPVVLNGTTYPAGTYFYPIPKELAEWCAGVTRFSVANKRKWIPPQMFVDKLRERFDGGDHFVYRIFDERSKSYTLEEFLKLPPRDYWRGTILVCRDGFGWGETANGEVFGFPCPWNVPGPGEVIRRTNREEVWLIVRNSDAIPSAYDADELLEKLNRLLEP